VCMPVIVQLDFLLSFLLFPFPVMRMKTFYLVRVVVVRPLPSSRQRVPMCPAIRHNFDLLPSHNAYRFPFFIRFS
jgi:hypothetical protein